jgi:hypothetical protein
MPPSTPERSTGLLSDLRLFVLRRPRIRTSIDTTSPRRREDYMHRIRQRLGAWVADYSVLNIHRIGIQAPAKLVFEELNRWDGSSSCWPNHLALFERVRGFEDVRILLFGWEDYPLGFRQSFLGLKFIPLFRLSALTTQNDPPPLEQDNARYLLFRCSGGYPIGLFAAYVRSPVADLDEPEQSQFFMVVGFDFYGQRRSGRRGLVGRAWEAINDRITANMMNRFKALCEWRFEQLQGGG